MNKKESKEILMKSADHCYEKAKWCEVDCLAYFFVTHIARRYTLYGSKQLDKAVSIIHSLVWKKLNDAWRNYFIIAIASDDVDRAKQIARDVYLHEGICIEEFIDYDGSFHCGGILCSVIDDFYSAIEVACGKYKEVKCDKKWDDDKNYKGENAIYPCRIYEIKKATRIVKHLEHRLSSAYDDNSELETAFGIINSAINMSIQHEYDMWFNFYGNININEVVKNDNVEQQVLDNIKEYMIYMASYLNIKEPIIDKFIDKFIDRVHNS